MATIAENLQTLIDQKKAIKESLENHGKEVTNELCTYAPLIDTLENPEEVVYCVTFDGENKKFAQLHGSEKVTLTATANDIRINTSAITDTGYTDGTKEIPAYHTRNGAIKIKANNAFKIPFYNMRYDYTELQAMTAPYNTSTSDSVAVDRVVIENSVYNVGSTEVISSVIKNSTSKSIDFGITNGGLDYVIRYFTYRKEV